VTAVVEGAKRLLGRKPTALADRVEGLRQAVDASRGRLPDDVVERAGILVDRATRRLSLAGGHTVVALAGATGSGKSSIFNAVIGMELAAVGVRRPTTAWTMACVWGEDPAAALLDWLEVPGRHRVSRRSMLDEPQDHRDLDGLVLLDLPDHDSTEVAHHLEVERLVQLADLLVWVLDPQKYADAALHDRFLRPLAGHRDVMLFVLNHIDEVPGEAREAMVADLRRLLRDDGLADVALLTTSATEGDGIAELKQAVARRVATKKATTERLLVDVTSVASAMREASGTADPKGLARSRSSELVDSFAEAAGVPTVVHAVERATRMRAARATGWPVVAWVSRLRPDPLKRLHLDVGASDTAATANPRSSVPPATAVQRARVGTAVREVADDLATGLRRPWADAVRRASTARLGDLGDALDGAIARTDLGAARTPLWWRVVRVLQWVLVLAALGGALWLAVLAFMRYLDLDVPATPDLAGFAVPTVLLVGGVVVGVVLALLCRLLTALSARARARSADRRLRDAIGAVTDDLVVAPIEAEIDAYERTRAGLATALR
jgi:GTPase Era involved in 16S rRNA processing